MKKKQIILSVFPFVGAFFYGLHVYTLNRRNFSKVFFSWFAGLLFLGVMIIIFSLLPISFTKHFLVFITYFIIAGMIFNIIFCLLYNYFDKQNDKYKKKKYKRR